MVVNNFQDICIFQVVHGFCRRVVINENDKNIVLSARNIPNTDTVVANMINVYDIMKAGTVVVTKDAVSTIEEVYA